MTFAQMVLAACTMCLLFGGYSIVNDKWPGAVQFWMGVCVFSKIAGMTFGWASAETFGLYASAIGGTLTLLLALGIDFVKHAEAQEEKRLAAAERRAAYLAKFPDNPEPTEEPELTLAELDPNFNANGE